MGIALIIYGKGPQQKGQMKIDKYSSGGQWWCLFVAIVLSTVSLDTAHQNFSADVVLFPHKLNDMFRSFDQNVHRRILWCFQRHIVGSFF
jgi:hypothetical protein